jgi:hypothetical protein
MTISSRLARPLRRVYPFPGIKLRISRRNGPGRNPQNGVEGIHWIEATVETEYEFIEIGLQMTRLNSTMMSAIDPRLQVGEDKMDHRQMFLCFFRVAPKREYIMPIAPSGKVIISLPAVSADDGVLRHILRDECGERLDITTRDRSLQLFDTGNDAEPKTPSISEFLDWYASFVSIPPFHAAVLGILTRSNLDGANYRRLMMNSPSFTPRSPANATFVYFDGMRHSDSIAVWPHHASAKLVEHSKCRLIGRNIKLALELNGRLAWRLCRHEIRAPKPRRERHMARLHDRSGGERRVFFTGTATQHNGRAGRKPVRLASKRARRTGEAVRPADRFQIFGASGVIRKDALEFRKARWEGCIHV